MHITNITLQNFRCFETLSLSLNPHLNVFFGGNGAGKSAILEAINIILGKIINSIANEATHKYIINSRDIMNGTQSSSIDIEVELNGLHSCNTFSGRGMLAGGADPTHKSVFAKMDLNTTLSQQLLQLVDKQNAPILVSYGAYRHATGRMYPEQADFNFSPLSCYYNAIDYDTDFDAFYLWFKEREDLENELFRHYEDNNEALILDPQLTAVRGALARFLPHFSKMRVQRKTRSFTIEKNDTEVRIAQLSDGEKGYITLVGDIARRLAIANPSLDKPLEGKGIILIDEIELHLHPKWQRMIIPKLHETFPNCQFIVTSHSPQVLGEVEAQFVWILEEGETPYHPKYAYGLTSSEILDGYMGAESRNAEVTKRLEDIDCLIDDRHFDKAREAIKELAKITGRIPAIVGSNSYLTMMGEDQAEIEEK